MNECGKGNRGERSLACTIAVLAFGLAFPVMTLHALQVSAVPQLPSGVDIQVQAQPLKATVGDPLRIDFDFTLPLGYQLQFPTLPEQLGEFTILETFPGPAIPPPQISAKPTTTSQAAGSQTAASIHHQARVVASVYRTGEFEFPALQVALKDKEGRRQEILTPPIKVQIESVLNEKNLNLKDLKKQAEITEPFRWLLWLTLGGMAILLVWLAWWWRKHHRRAVSLPPVLPEVDPLDQAEADFQALLTQGLLDRGMIKQFYVRLSEIIKQALEASYEIPTMEKTTSEIMAALAQPPESGRARPVPACLERVETLLLSCDMVKFARYIPAGSENDEATAMARQVLNDCKDSRQPAEPREVPVAGVS